MKSPILLLIFNRLDTTQKVLEAIRNVRPQRLYIAADGARVFRPADDIKIKTVRDYVMSHIDWECEARTLFREKNLGCKYAVSEAIDWFFENEEMGIIIEDDCLPHISFFRFCDELLDRYQYDKRIGIISGDNFHFNRRRTEDSYYFSLYAHIWGWASWRRTWRNYDVELKQWPSIKRERWLYDILQTKSTVKYWESIFDAVFRNQIDTWDYQLNLACWVNSMINIIPAKNMVSNIGFGADASRTTQKNRFSDLPVNEMIFPLQHPSVILRDSVADKVTELDQFRRAVFFHRIAKRIRCRIS